MTLRIHRRCFVAAGIAALAGGPLRAAERLASVQPGQVLELRVNSGPTQPQDKARPPVMSGVAVSPGARLFATAGDDHLVRIWNHEDGKLLHTLRAHQDWVRSVVFTPDGRQIISAGDDHRIIYWDAATGQMGRVHPRHDQVIYNLALSPDGRRLAAVGFEEKIRVYDATGGQEILGLVGPCEDLRAVAFSPDGARLAAAGRNGRIRIWSMADGLLTLEINAGLGRIRSVAFSPAGDALVSAGDGRTIAVWDPGTGKNLGRLPCKTGKVMALKFCGPSLLASGGTDNLVHMWDIRSQTEQFQLAGHTGTVTSLDYDAQAEVLVSASYDTTVRVWPLKPELAEQAEKPRARALDVH